MEKLKSCRQVTHSGSYTACEGAGPRFESKGFQFRILALPETSGQADILDTLMKGGKEGALADPGSLSLYVWVGVGATGSPDGWVQALWNFLRANLSRCVCDTD